MTPEEARGGFAFECPDCEAYQWAAGDSRLDAVLNHYQAEHGLGEDGEE